MEALKQYMSSRAVLVELEKQPEQLMAKGMRFKHFHTNNTSIVRWEFDKGVIVPHHHHYSEQITTFLKGKAKVILYRSDGEPEEQLVEAGTLNSWLVIPSNVPHEFHILEDAINLDIFTPVRQDWIDGMISFYNQES